MASNDMNDVSARLLSHLAQEMIKAGGFDCACCELPKPLPEAGSLGIYVPKDPIQTVAGPKTRLAAYAVCKKCVRTWLEKREVAERIERNLVRRGIFMDPRHDKDVHLA
jgi:hypothetical protein